MGSLDVDLLDLAHYRQGPPHGLFRRLREEGAVHWHPEAHGSGFWAVMRHAEVVAVSRDSATYSSERGGVMIEDPPAEALALVRHMMLNMDPPAHSRLRSLVN